MLDAITESVKINVNGKIDKMSRAFDEYVKEDRAWKDRAQPALDAFDTASKTKKVVLGFFATIGIIAGSLVALIKLIKGQ